MKLTRDIPWTRVIGEGAVIVVSILLAFWIDASWDRFQERREEQLLLASLHDELRSNHENLAAMRRFHEDVQSAIRELLEQAALPAPSSSESEIDTLIGMASWFDTASNFEMSAVDAVVIGGSLSKIENQALRRKITGWSRDVEHVIRVEAQDYDTFSQIWMPFLRQRAYLTQIHNQIEIQPGSGTQDYIPNLPIGAHTMKHSAMLQDREFQNVLLHRLWVQGDILYQYGKLEPKLVELIDLLTSELKH